MDSADAQSVVVEAESWQKALHAARVARGETGPISGFSIELLDEGYRAVDPLARRRYDVKRAAEGTPVTASAPASIPAPAQPPAAPASAHAGEAPHAMPPAAAVEVPRPAPTSRKPPPAPPASKPAQSFPAPASKRPPSSGKVRAVVPVAPPPEQVIVPTAIMSVASANGGADATIRTEAVHVAPSSPLDRTVRGADAPPAEVDFGPIPPTQVIFKREHDPNERLPLTYREYVFTVARGVNEESGERLLRAQFHQVRASIANARPGKFVNLAVFDVVFQGKPPVPPLATLAWKDWRGEPVIAFPRRPSTNHAAPTPPPPPSFPAPAPTPIGPPVSAAPPAPAAPIPVSPPAVPPSYRPPAPVAANPFVASFPAPPGDPFAPGGAPLPPGVPVPLPPGVPVPVPPGVPVPAFGAPAPPALAPAAAAQSAPPLGNAALIAAVAPSHVPPMAAPAPTPPVPPPPPAAFAPPVPPPPPAPAPAPRRPSDSAIRSPAQRLTPTGSRPSFRPIQAGRRATGDELIANLFEAMHELHFTRDVIEGGDYVLSLALEMIPSRFGLLHLYDIDRREYVIACVAGNGAETLLNRRMAESEPLFVNAMRKHRALVFADARSEESTASAERFVILGGALSVIVSPIMKGGRFLGILELMNPLDGIPFTEDEGNAIDYLSEQFGEFVATRGTQLDPDRIARSVPPGPPEGA